MIQFDPAKDAKNIDKHGVSLAAAEGFEWEQAVTWPDRRRDYGEDRIAGLGYIGDRLFMWCLLPAVKSVESSACERPINER